MINKNRIILLLFLILLTLPVLSLFRPGLPVTHDGRDHVARIANFYAALAEGISIPRWGSNLNWGFGHPVLMFLYPLPSYAASVMHGLGISLIDSTKLIFALSFIASGIAMFIFGRSVWGMYGGIVSALLYTFAPYRFVDLHVRGALGEHVAFMFLPLILFGINKLQQVQIQKKYDTLLVLAVAGLILSHNAVSLMMIPVALLYTVFVWLSLSKHRTAFLVRVIGAVGIGVLLSAFFWLPAFFEGKYTLRDIVTQGEVLTRMVPLHMFIFSPWNYGGGQEFTKSIGFMQWGMIALLIGIVVRTKHKISRRNGIFLLAGIGLSMLIMTDVSALLWKNFTLLQKFQFPWRLLTITVLLTSLAGGFVMQHLPKKRQEVALLIITLGLLGSTFFMWQAKGHSSYDERYFTGVYAGTTDTGESSPIWSVRFMEFFPAVPMEIAEGEAVVTPEQRTTTRRTYRIDAKSTSRLVENTLYFPGWKVIVNGKSVPIEFQDPTWRGRMTFFVPPGIHTVAVEFTDTKLRSISQGISLVGVFLCIAFWIAPVSVISNEYPKKKKEKG